MSFKQKMHIVVTILIILAAAMLLQIAVVGLHHTGLYIILGFFGSGALITVGKKIVGPVLQRKEDYYDDNEENGGGSNA